MKVFLFFLGALRPRRRDGLLGTGKSSSESELYIVALNFEPILMYFGFIFYAVTACSTHVGSLSCHAESLMRLNNDSYSSDRHGIVEVLDNGVWKRICHQNWDDTDSGVACRELGFKVMGAEGIMMYLWWSLRNLYLHACQVRVTVGDSDLCCFTCVTYFDR